MGENNKKLVKRQIFSQIAEHLKKPEITLIIGPRQVGKTTLLFQLKDYLIQSGCAQNRIFVFNLDIITERDLFSDQQRFIDFLKERITKEKIYIFVDEAQRVENANIFFKGIYDLNMPVKFVLTGSSVLEIKSKINESLTGRKRIFYLYPFNFNEYLSIYDETLAKLVSQKEISSYSQEQIKNRLLSFIIWGGYPKAAFTENISEKQEILKEIFSSYVEKDIIGFLRIKKQIAFTKLVAVLSSQIGQLLNISELSESLQISRKTIEEYLEILEKTFIIKSVSPFFKNRRKELTKMPKIYFIDTGLRNFAEKYFADYDTRQDKGALLENFVFSEIFKKTDLKINFWRTKEGAEVDFILTDNKNLILPVEVKSAELKAPKITRSLSGFAVKYKIEKAILINLGFRGETKINKTDILFIQPYEIERVTGEIFNET